MKIISYSELFKWDTCQRQWYYRFSLGLKPTEEAEAMVTGTKGHKLLQTFYTAIQEGLTQEQALKKTQDSAVASLKEDPLDFGLITAWVMVEKYIKSANFTKTVELVENRFLFPASVFSSDPIFDDVHIGFTPDVVFKREGGFYTVEDAKFVQRAWSKGKLNRFQQAKIYQIFLKQMGYNVTQSSVRFFNVKTSEIRVQNYTTGELEEAVIIRDMLAAAKELLIYRQNSPEVLEHSRRTNNYTACTYCAFNFPCGLEAEGKDASKTLKNMFKKSDYDYSK